MRPDTERNAALMSYRQVACKLGISQARVRQLEQRALAKLRRGMAKLGIRSAER